MGEEREIDRWMDGWIDRERHNTDRQGARERER